MISWALLLWILGSGALNGKMLLVRINEKIKLMLIFVWVRLSKGLGKELG